MKIQPLERLIQPDARTLRFTPQGFSLQGTLKPEASLEFVQGLIKDCLLDEKVPDDLRKQFDTICMLHVHGFFVYEFFTIAFSQMLFLLEGALRLWFAERHQTKKTPSGLQSLLAHVENSGALSGIASKKQMEALRRLRDHFAHPKGLTILTPIDSAQRIRDGALLINALWGEKTGAKK